MSEPSKNQAAPPGPRPGPKLASFATAPLPKQHAVLIVASTVLVMAILLGRDDTARGPLWHIMWMVSFVVVLGSGLGTIARLLHPPRPAPRPAPRAAPRPAPLPGSPRDHNSR